MTQINTTSPFSHPFSQTFQQLGSRFYSKVTPTPLKQTHWIHFNTQLAQALGINKNAETNDNLLSVLSGEAPISGQTALSMVYAGHQFGGYSPQLGDGRAIMIAKIASPDGIMDLQLKGAGKTPYSRFGDGRAVLRSSIREYLAGEAMHHLGIPTTRALSLIGSTEPILREQMETGAIVARVARSHIRFGHFEFFFYTKQHEQLQQLADYVIDQFLPEARHADDKYAQLLQFTTDKTAQLMAQWQSVGFAHGVMNTDNMSIIGETLDYGPYGFLDDYEPGFICNHSDHTGRYAFDRQPSIGLWNLNALAHALSPLIDSKAIQAILQSYEATLVKTFSTLMRQKLGLTSQTKDDQSLCAGLLGLMAEAKADYTTVFRQLCDFNSEINMSTESGANNELSAQFAKTDHLQKRWRDWSQDYARRLQQEQSNDSERQQAMKQVNPKFIARNYLLQNAINKAQTEKDYTEIDTLFKLLQTPFDEHPDYEEYAKPSPEWGKHLSISCSS